MASACWLKTVEALCVKPDHVNYKTQKCDSKVSLAAEVK